MKENGETYLVRGETKSSEEEIKKRFRTRNGNRCENEKDMKDEVKSEKKINLEEETKDLK